MKALEVILLEWNLRLSKMLDIIYRAVVLLSPDFSSHMNGKHQSRSYFVYSVFLYWTMSVCVISDSIRTVSFSNVSTLVFSLHKDLLNHFAHLFLKYVTKSVLKTSNIGTSLARYNSFICVLVLTLMGIQKSLWLFFHV